MVGLKSGATANENRVDVVVSSSDGSRSSAPPAAGELSEVDTRSLPPGTEIIVDTTHSKYRLRITDGPAGLARMQGGRMFVEPTAMRIEGTRGDAHRLIPGLISVGHGLHFIVWNERGCTSPVQSIAVSAPSVPQGGNPETARENGDEQ